MPGAASASDLEFAPPEWPRPPSVAARRFCSSALPSSPRPARVSTVPSAYPRLAKTAVQAPGRASTRQFASGYLSSSARRPDLMPRKLAHRADRAT
jgi:hypothetical protein